MKTKYYVIIGVALLVAIILFDMIVFPYLPNEIPVEFVFSSKTMEKNIFLLVMLTFMLVSFFIMLRVSKPHKIKYVITSGIVFLLNFYYLIITIV